MPTLEQDYTLPHAWKVNSKNEAGTKWFKNDCSEDRHEQLGSWNDRHSALMATNLRWSYSPPRFGRQSERDQLYDLFFAYVNTWKNETAHLSSLAKMFTHPSYLRIIALGGRSKEVVRFLLEELRSEPDHWFAALKAITGEDPASPDSDFDSSVEAWLRWGEAHGLI